MNFEQLVESYKAIRSSSERLFKLAKEVLPGGVSYSLRYFKPFPFYVSRANGSRIWDLDGNEYIDFWMVHGAAVLGHNHPLIIEEAIKGLREVGAHLGWSNPWEVKWAEAVTEWFKMDMVRPTNSGTEANMYAVRLARAYTGRRKIAKLIGGWHGSYDGLHYGVSELNERESLGLSKALQEEIVLLKPEVNDLEEKLGTREVAAVVVEAVMGGAGALPLSKSFLHSLQEICKRTGTLFILDEVITGFRFMGGAKAYYNLDPDIVVTGKAVGGQYFAGAGAILGRRDIMKLLDQEERWELSKRVFHGGTYTGNTLTSRAGYKLIRYLMDNPQIYSHLEQLGDLARNKLREVLSPLSGRGLVTGAGSMIGFHILRGESSTSSEVTPEVLIANKDKELMELLHLWLINKGIAYLSPTSPHLFISVAHTDEDIEDLAEAIEEFTQLLIRAH